MDRKELSSIGKYQNFFISASAACVIMKMSDCFIRNILPLMHWNQSGYCAKNIATLKCDAVVNACNA